MFFAKNILLTPLETNTFSKGGVGLVGWTTNNTDIVKFNNLEVVDYGKRVVPNEASCTLVEKQNDTMMSNLDLRINHLGALGIDSNVRMSVQPNDLSVVFSVIIVLPQLSNY